MPRVPFPDGISGSERLPRSFRSLTNCFNNQEGHIISRPGIAGLNTTGNRVARGQFVWNDSLYQVVSENLIKITNTETGSFTVIGTIAGSEVIDTAVGFNDAVIVVKGGTIYTLNAADTLTVISTNPNFKPTVAVAHINGRFVYIPADGSPAFFSDVGDAGTVQASSFFDAEELPDKNNTVFNFKNTLYIGGTDSFELFRDTGATPNPFGRIEGARIINGFIGGLIEYNETFLFIGREKDQDFGIYAIGQGVASKISNETIDLSLAGYTQAELAAATGGRLKWRGYDIATFTLARDSYGFYAGNWFRLDTLNNGVSVPWGAGYITQYQGEYFTAFQDKIGKLSTVNSDYGEKINRFIITGFEQEDNDYFTCQSVDLGISQGYDNAISDIFAVPDIFALIDIFSPDLSTTDLPPTVGIAFTRNNVEYGDPVFRELGELGQYTQHLEWNYPGGMGMYNGFMGLRIQTTQNVDFSSDHLIANFR